MKNMKRLQWYFVSCKSSQFPDPKSNSFLFIGTFFSGSHAVPSFDLLSLFLRRAFLLLGLIFYFFIFIFFCREPCYSFVWSLSPLQLQILDLSHSEIEYRYNHILKQGGRTWQPFVGGKNGHENFRLAHIYNFRDKCVIFAGNRKFANLVH